MSTIATIAAAEWRLWLRSKSALAAFFAVLLVIAATSALTLVRIHDEREARLSQQAAAEEAFLNQPARHPHRMVHYGHYVFRAPPPLAIIDPGVDAVTGQSIFLEGHRQNTAMFADARASANVGGFQTLSPAHVYQILIPLLLIALGHAVFVREREAKTLAPLLAQGVTGVKLYAGKALALAGLSAALIAPLLVMALIAIAMGEGFGVSLAMVAVYGAYLLVWSGLVILVSALTRTRALALGVLVFIWLALALIAPRISVTSASAAAPSPGKLETDYQLYADLRELGDGHNASDPAFAQLRANLLAEYDVDSVEELPINFRGVVAESSEASLTEVMNEYAERRMDQEVRQSVHAERFGWLSPSLAVSSASRALAGVDLETHHRFLREAEAVRYDFVQGLNRSHIHVLSYTDDINRGQSEAASQRARISPENWAVLNEFEFEPDAPGRRIDAASGPLFMLAVWLLVLLGAGLFISKRLKP